jgi:hypothetical protein
MTEVPKIVYDRLRAARPHEAAPPTVPLREQAHPDANLLTAFAEQSLSATEREGVLDHLAVCGDCRDVIVLALPAADFAAAPVMADAEAGRSTGKPSKNRLASGNFVGLKTSWLRLVSPGFSGSGLRWAAVAAGIAVVASVLLVRPGKLNQSLPLSANRQVATTAPPASGTQLASSSVPATPAYPPPMNKVARSSGSNRVQPKRGMQLTMALKANQTGPRPPLGAYTLGEVTDAGAAAPAVRPEPSTDGTLLARNDAPAIEKAKPALQSTVAQSADADKKQNTEQRSLVPDEGKQKVEQKADGLVNPSLSGLGGAKMATAAKQAPAPSQVLVPQRSWTIAGGVLHRSLDQGYSWQEALRANQPLICVASQSDDVWTGGTAGTLFHSANGGLTWLQVQPSIKTQQLSWDITHINLRGAEVVVSGSNNQMWSSADGGKTWRNVE